MINHVMLFTDVLKCCGCLKNDSTCFSKSSVDVSGNLKQENMDSFGFKFSGSWISRDTLFFKSFKSSAICHNCVLKYDCCRMISLKY